MTHRCSSPLVGASSHLNTGQQTGAGVASPGGAIRRLPDRLGSRPREQRHQQPMAWAWVSTAYQSSRIAGYLSSTPALPARAEEPPCAGENRQHSGSGVYKQAGGPGLPMPCRLARTVWECAHSQFKSLREMHVPGQENLAADQFSRENGDYI